MDKGKTPYKSRVKKAPSTLPWLLVASATAIITATYIQAMPTRYMRLV
jgi:Mg/Co/Ni transporter MgtE